MENGNYGSEEDSYSSLFEIKRFLWIFSGIVSRHVLLGII